MTHVQVHQKFYYDGTQSFKIRIDVKVTWNQNQNRTVVTFSNQLIKGEGKIVKVDVDLVASKSQRNVNLENVVQGIYNKSQSMVRVSVKRSQVDA